MVGERRRDLHRRSVDCGRQRLECDLGLEAPVVAEPVRRRKVRKVSGCRCWRESERHRACHRLRSVQHVVHTIEHVSCTQLDGVFATCRERLNPVRRLCKRRRAQRRRARLHEVGIPCIAHTEMSMESDSSSMRASNSTTGKEKRTTGSKCGRRRKTVDAAPPCGPSTSISNRYRWPCARDLPRLA